MSSRFTIRKNSGDHQFPWTLLDASCVNSERHDFSARMPDDCNGNCDAYISFEDAIKDAGLIQ